jgi:hypothetical protein
MSFGVLLEQLSHHPVATVRTRRIRPTKPDGGLTVQRGTRLATGSTPSGIGGDSQLMPVALKAVLEHDRCATAAGANLAIDKCSVGLRPPL